MSVYNYTNDQFEPCFFIEQEGNQRKLNFAINDIINSGESIFIATGGMGLMYETKGIFKQIELKDKRFGSQWTFHAQSMKYDDEHNLWVFVQGEGLAVMRQDQPVLKIVDRSILSAQCLEIDQSGNVWLGLDHGVYRYNIRSSKGQVYLDPIINYKVVDIKYNAEKTQLWIATDGNGLLVYDEESDQLKEVKEGLDNSEINSNAIYAIYQDETGSEWLGTGRGGVNVLEYPNNMFRTISRNNKLYEGLISDYILSFFEQSDGKIWIGTDGAGASLWDRDQNEFISFESSDGKSLNNNFVTSIQETPEGVWFATYGGGVNLRKPDGSFKYYTLVTPTGRYQNEIWDFLLTSTGELWVATINTGGLFKYNKENDEFDYVITNISGPITLQEDESGALWIGTFSMLSKFDVNTREVESLDVGFPVRDIIQLQDGTLLVGTEGKGLLHYNPDSKEANYLTQSDGLPNNSVLNILQDGFGKFWLSTYNGISVYDAEANHIVNYFESDGLQSNQFNYNAAIKLKNGELMMGGIEGFNIIDPTINSAKSEFPELLISGIKVRNEPLKNTQGKTVFDTKKLVLPFDQSMVSIHFVALEYKNPGKIHYAYLLDGWDREWHEVEATRVAHYSKIEPGNYTFKVKSTDIQGNWNDEYTEQQVTILAPWYSTWWAFMLYILLIMALVIWVLQYQRERQKLKYDLRLSKELSKQNRELNEKKLTFFTNISHEFGSHLTMIVNPLKEVLKTEKNNIALEAAYQNARRLLSLLDQLLLFRKAESETGEIKISKLDCTQLTQEVYNCFIHQAKARNIQFEFRTTIEDCFVYGDRQKLEMALFNLISNSLKFANKDNGIVLVEIVDEGDQMVFRVQDNGQGIPEQERDKVFDLFYQTEEGGKPSKRGFGIGLYLVGKFMDMHKGEVRITDSSLHGAQIELILKKGISHFGKNVRIYNNEEDHSPFLKELIVEEVEVKNSDFVQPVTETLIDSQKRIFVIDDNDQIRSYLNKVFTDNYTVQEASSAEEALEVMSKGMLPDLIISDVVMNEMNGVELVREIKQSDDWRHIPVILLTSSKSDEIKLMGAEVGADDYISKPFDAGYLMARVKGLLRRQKDIQDHLLNEVTRKPENTRLSEEDKILLENVMSLIEQKMTDEDFNIKLIAKEIGLSHSLLYKKIKSVTGKSVNEFIRFIRLRKVANLLITTEMQINEAVYKAGFSDLKYFRKQFQLLYGMNPSEFQKKYRNAMKNKQYILNKSLKSQIKDQSH